MPALLSSGRKAGNVDDLQLDAVGIVEEHRVVPRQVRVLLRAALDLGALRAQPVGPLVDDARASRPRARGGGGRRGSGRTAVRSSLCASRRPSEQPAPERYQIVSPRSPSTSPIRCKPSGAEQVAVEGQAALDRGDDEVDVMQGGAVHVPTVTFRAIRACSCTIRAHVELFHYHLVTSNVREVEARYLGQARLPAHRALRADRRGPGALRGRRLVGGARAARASSTGSRSSSAARSTSSSSRASGRCRASTTSASRSTTTSSTRCSSARRCVACACRSTPAGARSSRPTPATGSRCTRSATGSTSCSRTPTSCACRSCTCAPTTRPRRRRRSSSCSRSTASDGEVVIGGTTVRFLPDGPRGRPELHAEAVRPRRLLDSPRELRRAGPTRRPGSRSPPRRRWSTGCGRRSSRPGPRASARFAGLYPLDERRFLAASTDGVGSKLVLSRRAGRLRDAGRDLAAHCIDDVLTTGAEPLFLLDYVAAHELDLEQVAELVEGAAEVCREAGCALIGGETAELPGVYREDELDFAGTCVGIVERERLIDGSRCEPGDVVLGLPSSGLHTNGFSLVRALVGERRLRRRPAARAAPALPRRRARAARAGRREGARARDRRRDPRQPVARAARGRRRRRSTGTRGSARRSTTWLDEQGVAEDEQRRVFNLGIGMCAVVPGGRRRRRAP